MQALWDSGTPTRLSGKVEGECMIVQAQTELHISCPKCEDGKWRADQLSVGQSTEWSCDDCHQYFSIKRVSIGDFEVTPTKREETPVTVTLQSITEPKITLKLNAWRYGHSQKDSWEDYVNHQRYFYDEHTCPNNWTSQIAEIIFEGDHDPHGVFEFVSVVNGHLVDSPYYNGMIPEQERDRILKEMK
jgi:ribosomal protein L37AE/L43A